MNELCHLWRSERYGACGDDVSDGVLFTGEKYPKAAGDTGAEGPVRAKRPRFPGPLSEMRLAAVGFKQPPYLKAVACRFGLPVSFLRPPSSVTYPDLKAPAIQGAISMPHGVFASLFSLRPR